MSIFSTYNDGDEKFSIKLTGGQFPSDKVIKEEMENILKRLPSILEGEHNKVALDAWLHNSSSRWKVPDRVQLPREFRASIFNKEFFTFLEGGEEANSHCCDAECTAMRSDDHYMQFICGFNNELCAKEDILEMTSTIGSDEEHSRWECEMEPIYCQNKKCKKEKCPPEFFVADTIRGFENMSLNNQVFFCKPCAEEYKRPAALRQKFRWTELPEVIVSIILDYCQPPFLLAPITQKERVQTSTYLDWMKFLIQPQDETNHWYINVNIDSSFYGRVMFVYNMNEIFIGGDIVEFEKYFSSFIVARRPMSPQPR